MSRWHSDRADARGKRWEKTPEGYLVFRGVPVTRCGVYDYADESRPDGVRREYRPYDEVMRPESLATLEGKPIVWKHPRIWGEDGAPKDVEVTAENHNRYSVGHVQNVRGAADGWPRADLYLTHAGAVAAVLAGEAMEVSLGYWSDDDKTPGSTDEGEPYDLIQRNIRYNHCAVVEDARAGSAARLVLDAADTPKKDEAMKTLEELKVELQAALDAKAETDKQVAELQKQLEDVVGELDALRAGADVNAVETEIEGMDPEGDMMLDEGDMMLDEADADPIPAPPKGMNLDSADFRKGVAHYNALQRCAAHFKIDNADKLPATQLRRKIVAAHMGANFKADASDGYYMTAVDLIAQRLNASEESRQSFAQAKAGGHKRDSADGKLLTHEDYAANRKAAATRKA